MLGAPTERTRSEYSSDFKGFSQTVFGAPMLRGDTPVVPNAHGWKVTVGTV